ncbi:putative DNA-binding domain-containing protein [Ponticoccus sp. (in: a-proteobacteria)]|uniref:HvfC/BufC family peptide modification chaperone n=1 Tax=Ponticoccus sp. (in: a-proteobacteria) TaxID=1925025 RepID=UPI003AB559D7
MIISQDRFYRGLLDPAQPVPGGLRDAAGRAAERRYAIYRNNVAVSLREALEAGFPAVARLLGPENFAMVAGAFLRRSPPRSPRMMVYGSGFPAFLEAEPRLAPLGYLGEVARLELALRQSYHAADAPRLDAAALAGLDEAALAQARVTVAPATRLLRSRWPVLSLYRYAMTPGTPAPKPVAEDVLVCRPGFDPVPHALPPGGAEVAAALMRGESLGAAFGHAGYSDPGPLLSLLLSGGALSALTLAPEDHPHACPDD